MKHTLFHWAFTVGVLMVLTGLGLLAINPVDGNLPNGFKTPIVAFEFMQTKQEVLNFLDIKDNEIYIDKLSTANALDFPFMLFYCLFLALTIYSIYVLTGATPLLFAILLCPFILAFDALENIQLGNILLFFKKNDIQIYLDKLNVYTWLKWCGISSVLFITSTHFLQGKWWMKLFGVVFVFQFILCVLAFFNRGVINEIYSHSIMLSFLLLLFYSWKNR